MIEENVEPEVAEPKIEIDETTMLTLKYIELRKKALKKMMRSDIRESVSRHERQLRMNAQLKIKELDRIRRILEAGTLKHTVELMDAKKPGELTKK